MIGISDVIAAKTGKKVSKCNFENLIAYTESELSPSYSVTIGTIFYAQREIEEYDRKNQVVEKEKLYDNENANVLQKAIRWIKENL